VKPPSLWGTEERLRELFRGAAVQVTRKHFVFRYRSPRHWLDTFRTYYGPVHKAFGALDTARQEALAGEMLALVGRFNTAKDGSMVVPGEYLEVVVTK
jgi:hypothetical protein